MITVKCYCLIGVCVRVNARPTNREIAKILGFFLCVRMCGVCFFLYFLQLCDSLILSSVQTNGRQRYPFAPIEWNPKQKGTTCKLKKMQVDRREEKKNNKKRIERDSSVHTLCIHYDIMDSTANIYLLDRFN